MGLFYVFLFISLTMNVQEDREAKRQLAHSKWYHNALRKGVRSLRMYATTKSQKCERNARLKRQWQKRHRNRAFAAWRDEAVEYIKMKRQQRQLAHDHYEVRHVNENKSIAALSPRSYITDA